MSNTVSNNLSKKSIDKINNFAVSEQAWKKAVVGSDKKSDPKPSWGRPAPLNYQVIDLLNDTKLKQDQHKSVKQNARSKILTNKSVVKAPKKQQPVFVSIPKDIFTRKSLEFRYLQQVKLWLKQADLNPDIFSKMQKLILPSIILQLQACSVEERYQVLRQVSQAQISGSLGVSDLDKSLLAFISAGESGFDLNHLIALDDLCMHNITATALPKVNSLGLLYLRHKVNLNKRIFSVMKVKSSPLISQALQVMEDFSSAIPVNIEPANIRENSSTAVGI